VSIETMLRVPEITGLDCVFGVNALAWMPPMSEIPAEYRDRNNVWNSIASKWFFDGLPASTKFHGKKGVDEKAALRVIGATLGSFAPKHEHKEAAVAYMLASWFDKVTGWKVTS